MAAQIPHRALVDWTIDPPYAAVECSLTHFTHWMRASAHSSVSHLTRGPGTVANTTVAAAHDPAGGPVLDDTMGEIADSAGRRSAPRCSRSVCNYGPPLTLLRKT